MLRYCFLDREEKLKHSKISLYTRKGYYPATRRNNIASEYQYAKNANRDYNSIAKVSYKTTSGGYLQAHLNYITQDHKSGNIYGHEDFENVEEFIKEFSKPLDNEKIFFKVILSPEYKGAELEQHARQIIDYMEVVQKQKFIWIASDHKDTDEPHSHIIIRGVDKQGDPVRLNQELIRNGIRNESKSIIKHRYGEMNTYEFLEKVNKQVNRNNVSRIDRAIDYKIKNFDNYQGQIGYVHYMPSNELEVRRLKYLEQQGLTSQYYQNNKLIFKIKSNFIEEVKQLQKDTNKIKEFTQQKREELSYGRQ